MDWGRHSLKGVSFVAACLAGLIILWPSRFYVYADPICYLDLAQGYLHRPWLENVNGIWGPLLPMLLAVAFYLTRPSLQEELLVADAVLYASYVFVLLAYLFFHDRLQRFMGQRFAGTWSEEKATLLFLFGFATIVAESCVLLGNSIQPDLLVAGFFLLACGFLLHFRCAGLDAKGILLFALVLALGYLAKGIFFPLSLVFIACFYVGQRGKPGQTKYALMLLALFLAFSSVQWLPLSLQKHRMTFADTGKINYVWFVPKGFPKDTAFIQKNLNGTPLEHPVQIVSQTPLVYGFKGVGGTFPYWFDPSYWMEGLHLTFQPVRQVVVFFLNTQQLLTGLFVHGSTSAVPGVGSALSLLVLLSLFFLTTNYKGYAASLPWDILVPALAGLGAYFILLILTRYIFGFVFVILVSLFSGLVARLEQDRVPFVHRLASALWVTTLLALFGGPIGYIRENLHDELRGGHWREMGEDPQAAEAQALHGLGLPEGAPVSQLGDLKDSYFLQLARLRVISEAADVDSFWQSTDADREKVYQILSSTGAQAVIAKAPVFTRSLDGWVLIGDSGFLFHSLK